MSNKFYKPKNEYGELLVGQPALEKAIADYKAADTKIINDYKEADDFLKVELIEKIDKADIEINNTISNLKTELEAADNEIIKSIESLDNKVVAGDTALDNKIDTFKTITVKVIENESIESYFQQVHQNKEMTLEELKVELGRTVYILKGSDDNISGKNTYEEYVCINPEILDENGRPEMVRLGAVDSILARCEDPTKGSRMGSVELVHNLYTGDDEVWGKYFTRDLEGKHIEEPIPGKAVAPCTLRAFWKADEDLRKADERIEKEYKEADEALKSTLESADAQIREEFKAADTQLKIDFEAADAKLTEDINNLRAEDTSLSDRINAIKTELMGTTETTDYSGSRIDKIEEAIGISGCPKCGREACDHDDPTKEQCTIYCRLNDIETDIVDLENNISDEQTRAEEVEAGLQESIDAEKTRAEEKEEALETSINEEKARALESESKLQKSIDDEQTRAEKIEAGLQKSIDDEKTRAEKKETEIQKALSDEEKRAIDKEEELNSAIKDINDIIGTRSSSSSKKIWETIDDNHAEAKELINQNAIAIEALETHISTKSSDNVDTVWGSINNSLNRVASLEADLGSKTSNFNNTAWHYIMTNDGRLGAAETNISSINGDISVINENIRTHETRLTKVETDVAGAISNIDANTISISELDTDIKANKSSIDAHAITLDNHTTLISNAETEISDIHTAISNINEILGKDDANIDGSSIWAAINATKDSIRTIEATKATKEELNTVNEDLTAKIDSTKATFDKDLVDTKEELEDLITTVQNSLGVNNSPDYPNTAWSYIAEHRGEINGAKERLTAAENSIITANSNITTNAADIKAIETSINGNNGILERLGAAETNITNTITTKADKTYVDGEIVKITTAAAIADSKIAALETSKTEIESDIADNANNISAINERIATANANISTLDTQVTTLYNQPRVAVITCSLPNDIPVNENNTYSNTKNIMLTDIVEKLPVSHPEKVNVAVTSVRYTSVPTGNGEAYGEQITPDILYYGGTSADNTNDRSFSITFNDYKQKPQSLIVTLVYWEEIDGNIIIHS